ncbi:MAG TPA: methyl-accepting chemotaxis protein [Calditerricola sp.]
MSNKKQRVKWFLDLSVRKKLLATFLLIFLVFLAANAFAWWGLWNVTQQVKKTQQAGLVMQLMENFKAQNRVVFIRVLEYSMDPSSEKLEAFRSEQRKLQNLAEQISQTLSGSDQTAFQKVLNQYELYRQNIYAKLLPAIVSGNASEVRRSAEETASLGKALSQNIDQLVGAMEKRFRTVSDRGLGYAQTTVVVLTVGLILSTVLGLALASLLTRYLTRSLGQIAAVAQRVAQGELRIEPLPVRSRDELGHLAQSINEMVEELRNMIHNVQDAARQLAHLAEALSTGAEQTSQAAQEIAKSVQEVADHAGSSAQAMEESTRMMKEMATGIQRITEAMTTVAQTAATGSKTAEDGNRLVQRVVDQMEAIAQSVDQTSKDVRTLAERTQQIETISAVITEIAEQTNLLALNAAIEAARAGEHGRGFSVVADEVRKLAEQAKGSVKEILTIIHGIQEESQRTTIAMETTMKEVTSGKEVVRQAGEAFARIVSAMHTVNGEVQEVAAVTEELSASSDEVTASVEEVSRRARNSSGNAQQAAAATEEQLASMEEIAASAASLRELAQSLRKSVEAFVV